MIEIEPERLFEMETKELWDIYKHISEEIGTNSDKQHKIKFGFKLKFPISYIINEWFKVMPKSRTIHITGYGTYKLQDFIDEKEQRERTLRKWIIENSEEHEKVEARHD